jgi:SAM-dependent methyltransferase
VKVKRALAYPLAIGTPVVLAGRIKECAGLIEPGHQLLDIGCSSGWLAQLVKAKGFLEYVGMDRAIVGAEHRTDGAGFVEGSVLSLPFIDESFDAVCFFDVIEHLPRGSEKQALSEIARILQRGGRLYFSTPHASPLHTPLDPVWALGHRHYRQRTIRQLLESTGFTIDRLFVAGGVVEGLEHIRLLLYKHLAHRTQPRIEFISRLIERSHEHNKSLGMTVYAVASR